MQIQRGEQHQIEGDHAALNGRRALIRGDGQIRQDVDDMRAGHDKDDDRGGDLHQPQPCVHMVHHLGLTPELAQFQRAERHFPCGENKVQDHDKQNDRPANLRQIRRFKEYGQRVHYLRTQDDTRNKYHMHQHKTAEKDTGQHLDDIGVS